MSLPITKASTAFAWALPGTLLIVALMAGALQAGAAPMASPVPGDPLGAVTLGRKNPFRPLIHTSGPLPALADVPSAPGIRGPKRTRRPTLAIAYQGIAYDGDESIAAVGVGGKVRFVRRGETLAGATLETITPEKLVWKKDRRRLETPLRHRPGASKP